MNDYSYTHERGIGGLKSKSVASLSQEHVQFLEQLSDEDFWQYAASCAYMTPLVSASVEGYLVCQFGLIGCFFPLASLRAVIPPPAQFSLLPATPSWMLGLTAWLSTPLAVVDFTAYLMQHHPSPPLSSSSINALDELTAPETARSKNNLLVIQHEDMLCGLLVPPISTRATLDDLTLIPFEQAQTAYIPPCEGAIKAASFYRGGLAGLESIDMLLDIPVILADIVQHLRIMAQYG